MGIFSLFFFFLVHVVFFCYHEKLPHPSVSHISRYILIWHHCLFFFSSTSRQTALGWAKIHKCFRKSLGHRPIPRGTNSLMSRCCRYVIWWLNFCCDWSDSNEHSQQVGSSEGGGAQFTGTVAQTGVLATSTYLSWLLMTKVVFSFGQITIIISNPVNLAAGSL